MSQSEITTLYRNKAITARIEFKNARKKDKQVKYIALVSAVQNYNAIRGV